MKSFTHYLILR